MIGENEGEPAGADDLSELATAVLAAPAGGCYGPPVRIEYRNWKGAVGVREITPTTLLFGESPYHDGPQYLLRAFDHGRGEPRTFAVRDILAWGVPAGGVPA